MSINPANQIKLSDGKTVGYTEYGDLQGRPVIYLHGLPSSRLEANNPDMVGIAERLHIHIIAPDRPGVGLSDFTPYSITGYPDMLTKFADKLDIDRFPVIGFSSGGKYAAACAWKIPQRLTAASIVCGNAPLDLPGVKATLSKNDRQIYAMAGKMPWLFQIMLGKTARDVRNNPASILSLFPEISEPDKVALARPNVKKTFEQMVVEAFRQGTRGAALDWKLEARPWGFSLQEIKLPVDIWHGGEDRLVSIEQARLMAQAIPNARSRFLPNEGHTLNANHFEEILRAVLE